MQQLNPLIEIARFDARVSKKRLNLREKKTRPFFDVCDVS